MTPKTLKTQEDDVAAALATGGKTRQARRIPERYDILIQCRDEAEQRELFDRLNGMGLKLRLLVL
ncbi:MAG TPA: hypothetical protein VGI40_16795 [Pirellulaceae bacterium]|jgi:hypothetical protein